MVLVKLMALWKTRPLQHHAPGIAQTRTENTRMSTVATLTLKNIRTQEIHARLHLLWRSIHTQGKEAGLLAQHLESAHLSHRPWMGDGSDGNVDVVGNITMATQM